MFGTSAKYLNYEDCTDISTCKDRGVEGVPSWLINNTTIKGKQTLERLSELGGCKSK